MIPANPVLEADVIASIAIDHAARRRVDELKPSDFWDRDHRELFTILRDLIGLDALHRRTEIRITGVPVTLDQARGNADATTGCYWSGCSTATNTMLERIVAQAVPLFLTAAIDELRRLRHERTICAAADLIRSGDTQVLDQPLDVDTLIDRLTRTAAA